MLRRPPRPTLTDTRVPTATLFLSPRGEMIADVNPRRRMGYLRRFADREGQHSLRQFPRDYRGLAPPAILKRVAERARYLRPRLAAAYRTILPSVTEPEFARLIDRFATDKPADAAAMRKLYDRDRKSTRLNSSH